MTARDILNHTLKSNNKLRGFSEISDFGVDVLENMMKKYAKYMCNKQCEICADNSEIEQEFTLSFGEPTKYVVKETEINNYRVSVNKNSILNAPYPDELI